jgi:hypothetical protein
MNFFDDTNFKDIKKVEYIKTEDKKDVLKVTLFGKDNESDGESFEVELEFEGTNIKSFKNGMLTWTAEYQNNKLVKINDTDIDLGRYFSLGYGAAPGEGVDNPESEDYDEDYINDNRKPLEAHGITFYTGPEGEIFKEIIAPVGDTIYLPEENPTPYEGHIFIGWYDQIDPDKETVQFPVKDVRGEKVYIAKYEKKYVDALYEKFNISKSDFPEIAVIINRLDIYVIFSKDAKYYNYPASTVLEYTPYTTYKIATINYEVTNYDDFRYVYDAISTKESSIKDMDNSIYSNPFYKTKYNVSSCNYFYTNDLRPSDGSLAHKWKQIY